jgi:hypothetical protein
MYFHFDKLDFRFLFWRGVGRGYSFICGLFNAAVSEQQIGKDVEVSIHGLACDIFQCLPDYSEGKVQNLSIVHVLPEVNPETSETLLFNLLIYALCIDMTGPGSSVGIATGYGLDGPGIESRWGVRFSAAVQTGPGSHPASYTMGTGSFLGVESGRSVTLTPHPFKCRGHETVELYLYSPYGYGLYRASVPVQACTLPFLLT